MKILSLPLQLQAGPTEGERSIEARALEAQVELLPYALAFFAIGLPVFVWAGAYATDAAWMSAIFVQFGLNWAAFYAVINMLTHKDQAALPVDRRTALHIGGSLLWALTVAEIAVFGANAGAVRDIILAIDVAAAVACMFFAAPCLNCLLVAGPAAAAAPLITLFLSPPDRPAATAASGALALAMALCLILNRILRRQFSLAAERETLISERARTLGEAERLAKSKSHLLATLSHEIRNGLTGVTHVLTAATGASGRSAPSRDQLAAALSATNELLEVLNATLDTETAVAGRLVLVNRPFDPAGLARATVQLHRPKAAARGLELDLHVDEGLSGAASGDPARVRQVLSSLVGNAVKYTSRGRVEIRVQRVGPDLIRFEVADTGPGLSPEELERAFEPFSRIERIGLGLPGAGLGLPLSRELTRLMGGKLAAESAVGVGSRFWFDLAFDPLAASAPSYDDAIEADGGPTASARNLRILLAQDDALSAAMLRAILEQLGHQVVNAQDGQRAVELAQFCQFDLIMLDGHMPMLTGPEAAADVRALSDASGRAPIIAVVGGEAGEAQACLSAGVSDVLRKPATVAGVARILATVVNHAEPSNLAGPAMSARTVN